jgi:hypothetical protein
MGLDTVVWTVVDPKAHRLQQDMGGQNSTVWSVVHPKPHRLQDVGEYNLW